MKPFKINDILYTKDGRKSGNLTIVDINPNYFLGRPGLPKSGPFTYVTAMSDYGNKVNFISEINSFDYFFATRGKATKGHKYYNYKETHPEEFI